MINSEVLALSCHLNVVLVGLPNAKMAAECRDFPLRTLLLLFFPPDFALVTSDL